MHPLPLRATATALAFLSFGVSQLPAQVTLIAKATLTGSTAGPNADLSGLKANLENGVPANLLGGLGSGLAQFDGDIFFALPDRGPNAVSYNALVDDTVSYIDRTHAIKMNLQRNNAAGLPFIIQPQLLSTTLLFSHEPLVYGSGADVNLGSGAPAQNTHDRHYFTGRSDNFDPAENSGDPRDGRFDPESIRLSNDRQSFFVSDEYGPHIYQFRTRDGERIRSFRLPQEFYVAHPAPTGDGETATNISGRVPNKGMEGLAITPDGRTLVGIMQNALIQDAADGGDAANLLRIVSVDVDSGKVRHEFAYQLTTGSGVSDILALNDHEFLVDERDGKGLEGGGKAKVKQVFKIDLNGATDVSGLSGTQAAAVAVKKTLFLDIVDVLTKSGITADLIPSKIEGLAFGPDVVNGGKLTHTLWVANDNDFLQDFAGPQTNPNQFFVFGFTDNDLAGSEFVPQHFKHEDHGR
ncbi:MAG TPA: esterase-like activity of phytase family protein [Terriglobales bacterium]